jgi:hypothetical protein
MLLPSSLVSRRNATLNQHGSRAVWLKGGTDVLITNLVVATRYAFDVSLSGAAVGTVVSKSRGVDLGVLSEGRGPFATLLTQVNFGRGEWGTRGHWVTGCGCAPWS